MRGDVAAIEAEITHTLDVEGKRLVRVGTVRGVCPAGGHDHDTARACGDAKRGRLRRAPR